MLKVTLSYCYFIVPDFKKSTCLDGVFIFQEQKLWFYTNSAIILNLLDGWTIAMQMYFLLSKHVLMINIIRSVDQITV